MSGAPIVPKETWSLKKGTHMSMDTDFSQQLRFDTLFSDIWTLKWRGESLTEILYLHLFHAKELLLSVANPPVNSLQPARNFELHKL